MTRQDFAEDLAYVIKNWSIEELKERLEDLNSRGINDLAEVIASEIVIRSN
ncbi:hypothetical protein LCGC14_0429590 [marine sediment metagenome]|uniref:Uncharacterized protein n=1 Tax=marine sediment metagenome TaxID=412755 RepID=A0A0F9VXT9_9ZZZZ